MLAASSPARSGLGEPRGEWEELWILEDRVRGVGASWNRKASARAYFAPDGQSQGELLSLTSQQSRLPVFESGETGFPVIEGKNGFKNSQKKGKLEK